MNSIKIAAFATLAALLPASAFAQTAQPEKAGCCAKDADRRMACCDKDDDGTTDCCASMKAGDPAAHGTDHSGAMDHGSMDHGSMDHGAMKPAAMDHSTMNHGAMKPGAMDHSTMDHGAMGHSTAPAPTDPVVPPPAGQPNL